MGKKGKIASILLTSALVLSPFVTSVTPLVVAETTSSSSQSVKKEASEITQYEASFSNGVKLTVKKVTEGKETKYKVEGTVDTKKWGDQKNTGKFANVYLEINKEAVGEYSVETSGRFVGYLKKASFEQLKDKDLTAKYGEFASTVNFKEAIEKLDKPASSSTSSSSSATEVAASSAEVAASSSQEEAISESVAAAESSTSSESGTSSSTTTSSATETSSSSQSLSDSDSQPKEEEFRVNDSRIMAREYGDLSQTNLTETQVADAVKFIMDRTTAYVTTLEPSSDKEALSEKVIKKMDEFLAAYQTNDDNKAAIAAALHVRFAEMTEASQTGDYSKLSQSELGLIQAMRSKYVGPREAQVNATISSPGTNTGRVVSVQATDKPVATNATAQTTGVKVNLPSTGEQISLALTIGGLVLALIAGGVFVVSKKKHQASDDAED